MSTITRSDVASKLKSYIVDELLEGDAGDFDESTPLLKCGILDSMSILGLVDFIERRFRIRFPGDKISAAHFESLAALTGTIIDLLASMDDGARQA